MSDNVDLKELKSDDLILELEKRGHSVDRPSDIDDFSEQQLRQALGIDFEIEIDWDRLYELFHTKNEQDAIVEIKKIIQQKTGRILL